MQTAKEHAVKLLNLSEEIYGAFGERELISEIEGIQLDAFRAGILHAANLKIKITPNEGDGYDVLKQAIRKSAAELKELPYE